MTAPSPATSHSAHIRRTRVLVVDDYKPSAMTLSWAMEDFGYEVLTCFDGREAIALSKTFHPDVVLLDLAMPIMGGLEACRLMRTDPDMDSTLIIAQTAWGDDNARRETYDAGFSSHLVKPIDLLEVDRMVRSWPSSDATVI